MVRGSGEGSQAAPKAQNKKAGNLGQLKVDVNCGYDKGNVKFLAWLAAVGRLNYSTNYMHFFFFQLMNLVVYTLWRITWKEKERNT